MKTIICFSFAIILLCLISCKSDSSNAVVVEKFIDIAFKSKSGNDLLNSETQDYFSPANIHIFLLNNTIKTEVNNPRMQYPNDFMIYKNDSLNLYFIRVFIENDSILLQLNQTITDTITTSFDKNVLIKLWYNGNLKWESGSIQRIVINK
jgi:hypothetical protein